jgi:phosphatidylserine/phosphatidylglycerophosphate/cardiolipin synthase-like enzyme
LTRTARDTLILRSRELAALYRGRLEVLLEQAYRLETESYEGPDLPRKFPEAKDSPRGRRDERLVAPRMQAFTDVRRAESYFTPGRDGIERFLQIADDTMLSGSRLGTLQQFPDAGIAVVTLELDRASLHLKTAVIDERVVITGSHNWTSGAAARNVEDLLIFDSPQLARYYTGYLDYIAETHAKPFAEIARDAVDAVDTDPMAAAGLRRRGEVQYPATLPDTVPRTRFRDVNAKGDNEAFSVRGHVEYLDDDEYLPVVREMINTARQSILVSMYHVAARRRSETVHEVLKELGDAAKNGVYVYLVLNMPEMQSDSQHETHSAIAERLRERGVDVRLNAPGALLHEKVVVVDLCKILIGSHNWSEGALTGDGVYESSALLVLPRQEPRFAHRLVGHPIVSDMRNRGTWEKELSLLRHLDSQSTDQRDATIIRLEQERQP